MTVNANNGWATARPTLSINHRRDHRAEPSRRRQGNGERGREWKEGSQRADHGGHVCTVATVGQQSAQRLSEDHHDARQHHPDREHRPDPRTDRMADVSGPAKHAEPRDRPHDTDLGPPMSDRSQQTEQRDRNEEDPALGRPETPGDDQHEDEAADAAADDPDEVEGSAAGDDSQISTGGDADHSPARGGSSGTR